jgi:16S rRNA (cytidine1402-2'-O)-methyltransferase
MTSAPSLGGKLYVVGTPIGNIEDLSPRARDVLRIADIIAAEDTRRARGLLSRIGVESHVIAFHEHNEAERIDDLLERLSTGATLALISDAGTPLISDPGWRLVHAARTRGYTVVPVPGPSAVVAALSVAGLPTDRFVFEGFLPRRAGARSERLARLVREPRTIVFFEAVHRLEEMLTALAEHFGRDRPAVLARELTKVHEQVMFGTAGSLLAALGTEIPLLGEFVIVVGGNTATAAPDEVEARRVYALLAAELPPDRALVLAAAITGMPRNELYRLVRVRD